jgi:hypothetical protein
MREEEEKLRKEAEDRAREDAAKRAQGDGDPDRARGLPASPRHR